MKKKIMVKLSLKKKKNDKSLEFLVFSKNLELDVEINGLFIVYFHGIFYKYKYIAFFIVRYYLLKI